ncbi:MAG: hypothetical protein IJU45_02840 [Clostridia bacterium]|nr:hypothetical protein [Clostridia bacterium]
MGRVKLLSYKYFLGAADIGGKTNDYTGSITLNPEHHSVFDEDFRYRVYLKKNEDGSYSIAAQYYVGNKNFSLTDPEIITSREFEGSDEGIQAAAQWIENSFDELIKE